MNLAEIQRQKKLFDNQRGWNDFSQSQVYVHLIEEIGEIGRHILYAEGYKKGGLGHAEDPENVGREFAQTFGLLLQLANMMKVNLETAYHAEIQIMKNRFPAKDWKKYTATRKNST